MSIMTILSGTMCVPTVDLSVVSQCLAFRFYTWIKATDQAPAQPPQRAVDLEALTAFKNDKDESNNDRQVQEKAMDSN
jgi:hypothetical protein